MCADSLQACIPATCFVPCMNAAPIQFFCPLSIHSIMSLRHWFPDPFAHTPITHTKPFRHPPTHLLTVHAANPKSLEAHSLMVMDMGQHVVQDLAQPLTLHQILVPGLEDRARAFPLLSTARQLSPGTLPGPCCVYRQPFVPAALCTFLWCVPACHTLGFWLPVCFGLLCLGLVCRQLSLLQCMLCPSLYCPGLLCLGLCGSTKARASTHRPVVPCPLVPHSFVPFK